MTRFIKPLIASFALFAMSVSASQAKADTWGHIQRLALDIQLKSDALLGETHHYVHTPNYQTMLRCISDMRARAVRIHVLSLQHGCLIAMAEELRVLDAQFHQIEALFHETEIEASHGHGHIHGPTRHIKEHLNRIEDCIHHIRDDIRQLTRGSSYRRPYTSNRGSGYSSGYRGYSSPYRSHPRSRVQYYQESCPSSRGQRYNSRAGISYSNDNFSIRIGF